MLSPVTEVLMSEQDVCISNPAARGMRLLREQFHTKASYAVYLHSQLTSFGGWLSYRKLLSIQAVFSMVSNPD